VSEVTRLLQAINDGEATAADRLLPLVYDELRQLATGRMAQGNPGQTLQATSLVHEAWLRLTGSEHQHWRDKSHFFAAAAEAMRRILIDQARCKASLKPGAGTAPEELHESRIEMIGSTEEALAVHEALEALQAEDVVAAQVVKLRYFVGMTIPEIAQALGISPRSADRHWHYARAWLQRAVQGGTSSFLAP